MSRLTVSDAKNDQYYQMKVLYEEFPENPIYSTLTKLVILSKLFNESMTRIKQVSSLHMDKK